MVSMPLFHVEVELLAPNALWADLPVTFPWNLPR